MMGKYGASEVRKKGTSEVVQSPCNSSKGKH